MPDRRLFQACGTLFLFLVTAVYARPADRYVDRNDPKASDANPGTADLPWATIQQAATAMKPGDTCWINPGTYEERIKVDGRSSDGAFRTFKAVGPVIVRGFQLENCSHVRLIGFEITQTAAQAFPAIQLAGADHCQILDNAIHHTSTIGIFFLKRAPSHNNLIRGNRMWDIGSVPGREIGEIAILVAGDRNIVEYNDISRVADFTNLWGDRNIIRNNYFHDTSLADFPDFLKRNPDGHHIDGLQYYSDAVAPLTRTLMENNVISGNDVPHAHVVLMRNVLNHPSSEFLFRGNIAVRNGAIAVLIEAFPSLRIVHNTFVDMLSQQKPKARYCFQITRGSTGAKVVNNILVDSAHPDGMTFYVDAPSGPGFRAESNLVQRSGRPAQKRGLSGEPRFVAAEEADFGLGQGSPAIDAGSALTWTAEHGQGTVVRVEDAGYFSDGWGITRGDLVRIGGGAPVRALRVDDRTNTIEIDRPLSWGAQAPVSYDFAGRAADIGALERRPTRPDPPLRLTSPAEGTAIRAPLPLRAEVPDPSDLRYIVFYVDGIPLRQIDEPPYETLWDPRTVPSGPHDIEARAYSRSAAAQPVRVARVRVATGPV